MRIGIASVQVPFLYGGAERHSENLCAALRAHGHEATEIKIPFKWYPPRSIVDHVLATKFIDVTEANGVPIDLLIGLKFPAYLLRHPNKTLWILHQHRQAYDLWDAGLSELLSDPEGPAVREFIRAEDRAAFEECHGRLFANSENVAHRIKQHLNLVSTPLYHPPAYAHLMRADAYGDFIFAPSRVCEAKRQKLLIEALAHCRSRIRLVIAGPPDMPGYDRTLQEYSKSLGVDGRIAWLGAVSDEVMADYYARARGVAFAPIDEDYGYVTLEAMLSRRAVITTTDAGGPLEFIRDRREGLIVSPTPQTLAKAFDELADDRDLAERMGEAGYAHYEAMNISWTHVVEKLTGTTAAPIAAAERKVENTASVIVADSTVEDPKIDMDLIRTHIAPVDRGPVTPAFTRFEDLYAAYDFRRYGTLEDLGGYFGTHWRRYLATLAFLPAEDNLRILDVGVFPPFVFQALIKSSLANAQITGVWEGPAAQIHVAGQEGRGFAISLAHANIDVDDLPFADNSFDIVLGLEILEHLAINPLLFVQEAARVLKPDGQLIISTPNITSHRSVAKVLRQDTPYSFGLFVPTGGVYGRHNREYTPHEVERLGLAAGFETNRLVTADVYDDYVDLETARLLIDRGDALQFRGETTFYVGRRGKRKFETPTNLYHGDPNQMTGDIRVERYEPQTGLGVFLVTNKSKAPWLATGPNRVSAYIEWFDAHGRLTHDALHLPLEETIPPGSASRLPFAFGAVTQEGRRIGLEGEARVELFIGGVGRMREAGRSNLVRVPCTEGAYLTLRDKATRSA